MCMGSPQSLNNVQQRPVIIVGPGCCGTSFLCQVLEDRFGVCFGHEWNMRSRHQGKLIYESRICKASVKNGDPPERLLAKMAKEHADEHCREPPGIKVLGMSLKSPAFMSQLNPRLLIHAHRDREDCVLSMAEYFNMRVSWARDRYDGYEWSISQLPVDLKMDMTLKRHEDEIAEILEPYLT